MKKTIAGSMQLCKEAPGNVRELQNIIERLMITVDDSVIRLEHLPSYIVAEHQVQTAMPEHANKTLPELVESS